jgi:hypothetical protein
LHSIFFSRQKCFSQNGFPFPKYQKKDLAGKINFANEVLFGSDEQYFDICQPNR